MNKILAFIIGIFLAIMIFMPVHLYGQTDKLSKSFDVGLNYTGDLFGNAAGGKSIGVRYMDNIFASLSIDLNSLIELQHTIVFVEGLGNQGGNISDLVGDVQGIDNIEAPTSWRLYAAWISHIFTKARFSILIGKYDLNTEFDFMPTAQLFINASQGIGAEYGLSGVLGPSTFPYTSLAARIKVNPAQGLLFKAAVFDGVPSDPGHTRGTRIYFHKHDGALIVAELTYSPQSHHSGSIQNQNFLGHGVDTLRSYRLTLGGWLYTEPRMGWLKPTQRGRGVYASIDAKLYHSPENANQGLAGYVRIGLANDKINRFTGYTGAGLVYTGLFKGRNEDQLGLATAIAWSSPDYKTIAARQNLVPAQNETDIEGTYLFFFSSHFQFQLDVQYVLHPNTLHSIKNAFVVGGRMILSL
jgi:porin